MSTPIIHCVFREGLSSVFQSQVLSPLRVYRHAGLDVRLVVFAPVGEFVRRGSQLAWQRQTPAIDAAVKGHFVRLPSPPARARWMWSDVAVFRWWLRKQPFSKQPFVLHCRGREMTTIALKGCESSPNARIIYDCRGIEHAEFLYTLGFLQPSSAPSAVQLQAERLCELERSAAHGADAVVCVSSAMKRFLEERFHVASEKITVSPCGVDIGHFSKGASQRDAVRAELGLNSEFVVVYCGSLMAWQLPDMSLRLFQMVREIEPGAHFLALTTQPRRMEQLLDQMGLRGAATVVSTSHDQVPRYLAAGDCGVLLRKPSLVNQVASPIKFGEYLAAGLPVFLSDGIGDFSSLVSKERIGVVLSDDLTDASNQRSLTDFLQRYRAHHTALRQKCRDIARHVLDLHDRPKYMIETYRSLCEGMEARVPVLC